MVTIWGHGDKGIFRPIWGLGFGAWGLGFKVRGVRFGV